MPKTIDPLEETAHALTDPIIVFPAQGWENDLPETLKKRLPIDRLAHVMRCSDGKASWEECCDAEALLYMYPRTMQAPLSERWTRIYLYLSTQVLGSQIPEYCQEKALDSYDMGELQGLKRWIQSRKVEARKRKERESRPDSVRVSGRPRPESQGEQIAFRFDA